MGLLPSVCYRTEVRSSTRRELFARRVECQHSVNLCFGGEPVSDFVFNARATQLKAFVSRFLDQFLAMRASRQAGDSRYF